MNPLKKKLKNDFIEKTNVRFKYDTSILPSNTKKTINYKKIVCNTCLITISCLLLAMVSIPVIASMKVTDSYRKIHKNYSIHELNLIESSSFKKLNDVRYPSLNNNMMEMLEVSAEFKEAMRDFTYNVYQQSNKEDNFAFSPVGLYSNLFVSSLASNQKDVLNEFDKVLGLTMEERKDNFVKMYRNNYFSNEKGTLQMYNSVFLSNQFGVNEAYLSTLSDYFVEAYQLDFTSNEDVDKMLNWVDQKLDASNFLDKKDLELDKDKIMYILSTFYFNNEWYHSFTTSSSYQDKFYVSPTQTMDASYMQHSYYGDLYEYDRYLSCYDYYANNIKIQYIISKDVQDNTFDLIADKNFMKETVAPKENAIIKLKTLKHDTTYMADFTETLKKIGLESAFNEDVPGFNYAFNEQDIANQNVYLDFVKQKNEISFNEDGTKIKSVTFSGFAAKSTAAPPDTYEVNLNHPYIYIIYDRNDLPLFIGNVNHS